jgi:hypothetical protein
VPSLVKNWPSGSGEEVENVKVYRQTDDGQPAIRKTHLSFSAQVSKKGQTNNIYVVIKVC